MRCNVIAPLAVVTESLLTSSPSAVTLPEVAETVRELLTLAVKEISPPTLLTVASRNVKGESTRMFPAEVRRNSVSYCVSARKAHAPSITARNQRDFPARLGPPKVVSGTSRIGTSIS